MLGIFANDEWGSIAMIRDSEDTRRLMARIAVSGDGAVKTRLDFPHSEECPDEMQLRLVDELKAFIESSGFGVRRTAEWTADEYNDDRRPAAVTRTPRPNFAVPSDCTQRRRRNGGRVMRIDRRRCLSAHRRS